MHVVVVDQGRELSKSDFGFNVQAFFLAPDNGVLTYVLQEETGVQVRSIENKQYRLDSIGATFDGRDLFVLRQRG